MLTNPSKNDKVWYPGVVKKDGDLILAPEEVTYLGKINGYIEFLTSAGSKFLWYPSQFFHDRSGAQQMCNDLNTGSNPKRYQYE